MKLIAQLVAVALVFGVLSGCTGQPGGDQPSAGESGSVTPAAASVDPVDYELSTQALQFSGKVALPDGADPAGYRIVITREPPGAGGCWDDSGEVSEEVGGQQCVPALLAADGSFSAELYAGSPAAGWIALQSGAPAGTDAGGETGNWKLEASQLGETTTVFHQIRADAKSLELALVAPSKPLAISVPAGSGEWYVGLEWAPCAADDPDAAPAVGGTAWEQYWKEIAIWSYSSEDDSSSMTRDGDDYTATVYPGLCYDLAGIPDSILNSETYRVWDDTMTLLDGDPATQAGSHHLEAGRSAAALSVAERTQHVRGIIEGDGPFTDYQVVAQGGSTSTDEDANFTAGQSAVDEDGSFDVLVYTGFDYDLQLHDGTEYVTGRIAGSGDFGYTIPLAGQDLGNLSIELGSKLAHYTVTLAEPKNAEDGEYLLSYDEDDPPSRVTLGSPSFPLTDGKFTFDTYLDTPITVWLTWEYDIEAATAVRFLVDGKRQESLTLSPDQPNVTIRTELEYVN
jgi:hypothetical protein